VCSSAGGLGQPITCMDEPSSGIDIVDSIHDLEKLLHKHYVKIFFYEKLMTLNKRQMNHANLCVNRNSNCETGNHSDAFPIFEYA